ncbi:MAG TPA: TonB-dependent receptor, partial [Gemmatimonadales bacterium]|nr:TonB-dependent receptor [Gemmatimonadales bacterium]
MILVLRALHLLGLALAVALPISLRAQQEVPVSADSAADADTASSESAPATDKPQATRLEAVTSVATRTRHSAFELPESVGIVDADRLETEQPSNLGEAVQHLPGVDIANGPRQAGEAVVIRGLSGDRVLVTVDGARQNFAGGHRSKLLLDPDLLKQVEVLRGPGSALWGSGALGGVLALTTKDAADFLAPGQHFNARARLGFQDGTGEQRVGATLAGRYGAFDVVGDIGRRDSDDLRLGGGDTLPDSALEVDSSLLKFGWDAAPGHRLQLSSFNYRDQGISPSNPSQPEDSDNPRLDRENDQGYTQLRYQFEGVGRRLSGAHLNLYRTDLDVTEDRVGAPRHDELIFDTRGVDAGLRFGFAPFSQVLSLGAEYYEDSGEATRNGAPRPQFPDARQRVQGLYLQDELQLTPAWTLIPGLRHDRFRSESNTNAARDLDESETSLRLGTSYQLTDWLALQASYGEAFRAPNLTELYSAGTHFLGNQFTPNPELRPEKAANKELGFRLGWDGLWREDDALRVRFSAYQNDVEDFIELVVNTTVSSFPQPVCSLPNPPPGCASPLGPIIAGTSTFENLRDAELKGGELEAAYELGRFTGEFSYARVRGNNRETGDPLALIPADTARLGLSYRLPWPGLRVGTHITRAARQDRVPPPASNGGVVVEPTDGYTVADLFAVWEPSGEALKGLR